MTRADEFIRLLHMSPRFVDGNEERKHINGLEHNLRVSSLAARHNPIDREMVFVGLVHDLARPLNEVFHGEVIAEMSRDLISDDRYDVLRTHGMYQAYYCFQETDLGYPDVRAPYHADAMHLVAWELGSFAKKWTLPTWSVAEAEQIIRDFCGDRP